MNLAITRIIGKRLLGFQIQSSRDSAVLLFKRKKNTINKAGIDLNDPNGVRDIFVVYKSSNVLSEYANFESFIHFNLFFD